MILARAMVLCVFFVVGCGGDPSTAEDASADARAGSDGGGPCVRDTDCPSNEYGCGYKIADGCSAIGHCARIPSPTCGAIIILCGCDGSEVRSGACFYADGFAGGPTTGASSLSCHDGGP